MTLHLIPGGENTPAIPPALQEHVSQAREIVAGIDLAADGFPGKTDRAVDHIETLTKADLQVVALLLALTAKVKADQESAVLRQAGKRARNVVSSVADALEAAGPTLQEDEDGAHYPGGVQAIAAERARQIEKGYTPEHDAEHEPRDLIDAAMGYLATAGEEDVNPYIYYPWMNFKRGTTQEHLVKAGALIAAALDLIAKDDPKDPE